MGTVVVASPPARAALSGGICVMSSDGSGITALTNEASDSFAAWSPDGDRIAFAGSRDGHPGVYDGSHFAFTASRAGSVGADIYVIVAVGNRQTNMTRSRGYDGDPAWSKDGRIAFSRRVDRSG